MISKSSIILLIYIACHAAHDASIQAACDDDEVLDFLASLASMHDIGSKTEDEARHTFSIIG